MFLSSHCKLGVIISRYICYMSCNAKQYAVMSKPSTHISTYFSLNSSTMSSKFNHFNGSNQHRTLNWYRQLQLIETQMNVTFRALFIPGGFTTASVIVIFSLYVCIKMHSAIRMPGFAFYPTLLIDAMLVIGVDFASAGGVYSKSKRFVTICRKWNSRKALRLEGKSLQPLKIRFGMNFIDELTSLTILDFCLSQTVSLLLIR